MNDEHAAPLSAEALADIREHVATLLAARPAHQPGLATRDVARLLATLDAVTAERDACKAAANAALSSSEWLTSELSRLRAARDAEHTISRALGRRFAAYRALVEKLAELRMYHSNGTLRWVSDDFYDKLAALQEDARNLLEGGE